MNIAKTTCLRPIPEMLTEFTQLWDLRNQVTQEKDQVTELAFEAARLGNTTAYTALMETVAALTVEEDNISAQMRPMQTTAWERLDSNLVTNLGRNDFQDKYWRSAGYTQTVVMGLKGTGAPAAGDTQSSHASWLEVGGANAPVYTGNRKAVTMGVAASQASVSPQQSFAITSSGTISGLFMNNGGSATKDDTTGTLVSVVNFTGGDEVVANLDTLLVTYTFNS